MNSRLILISMAAVSMAVLGAGTATAATIPFFFSMGNPDGKIGTLSRPAGPGLLETETADDFVTTLPTTITSAALTGLLPEGEPLSNVQDVETELYHVFPVDSTNPPSGNVPTLVNSPSDHEFAAFDSAAEDIAVVTTLLNSSFTVANTVVNGIHKSPNQFTGGEGPATGEEVFLYRHVQHPCRPSARSLLFPARSGAHEREFPVAVSAKANSCAGDPLQSGFAKLDTQCQSRAGLAPHWHRHLGPRTLQRNFFRYRHRNHSRTFHLSAARYEPAPSRVLQKDQKTSFTACKMKAGGCHESHNLTAQYGGDANFSSAASPVVVQTVH